MIKKRAGTVEIVDIPPEFDGAVAVAWKRVQQLSWGMPLFMLEAMKPMLISIYFQGFNDARPDDSRYSGAKEGERK